MSMTGELRPLVKFTWYKVDMRTLEIAVVKADGYDPRTDELLMLVCDSISRYPRKLSDYSGRVTVEMFLSFDEAKSAALAEAARQIEDADAKVKEYTERAAKLREREAELECVIGTEHVE